MVEGKTVVIDGLKIAYQETGSGLPVVMIHGNSCSKKVFARQFDRGLAAKYRLIAMDLPGHGDSDWAAPDTPDAYGLPFFIKFLAGFCRELHCDNVVLVGASLGGHIALEASPSLPGLRGIVIFGAPPLTKPPAIDQVWLLNLSLEACFKEEVSDEEVVRWMGNIYGVGVQSPEFGADDFRKTDPRVRSGVAGCVVSLSYLNEVEIARKLHLPLAVLHGGEERIANIDYIRELALPNLWRGDVQVIRGGSHSPQWDQPEVFNSLVERYLADIEP